METAQEDVQEALIKPGVDSKTHERALTGTVAQNLSEALGAPVTTTEVTPPQNHPVEVNAPAVPAEKEEPELDINDTVARWRGRPGDERSWEFLRRLHL